MRIERTTWENNRFHSAAQAADYTRAREIESNFNLLVSDIVQLNNSPADYDSNPGVVVLSEASLPKNADRKPGQNRLVRDIEATPFSGELTLDSNNAPTTLTMDDGAHPGSMAYLEAHHSKGFLGLGQDRLVIEQAEFGCDWVETATFFADGSIDYKMRNISP